MPLASCPRSGKLFDKSQTPVHPDVMDEEENDYATVLDYLAEHGKHTKSEVAEATGVEEACIQRMIDWGRLEELDEALEEEREEHAREEQTRRAEREAAKKAKLREQLEDVMESTPAEESGSVQDHVRDILARKRGER